MRNFFVVAMLLCIAAGNSFAQWNPNGATSGNIYYTGGNVGIGVQPVTSKLHVADGLGGEQVRLSRGTGIIRFAQDLNQDNLYLYNSDASKTFMFWKSNGYVGIGTYQPTTNLHIASATDGGIRIGSVNDYGTLQAAVGAQTAQYNLDFSGYRDMAPDQIGARISALRFNNYENNSALKQTTGLAFYTNPSGHNSGVMDLKERMRITPSGLVGIGTTIPTTDLHIGNTIGGGIRVGAIGDIGNVSVAVGAQTNQYNIDFSGFRDISPDQIGARIAALRFNGYENNSALRQVTGLAFYTNPSGMNQGTTDLQERMRITPSGNIGIGTTNPTQKLTVKGIVYSTEVKVDVNAGTGPDYVFEPTYQLTTLAETEAYIKANKHLPEVPSAKEMEANGINLSEMNMLLLKKVEELTLHLIEMKKENINHKQMINHLNSRLDSLQKK